MDDKTEDMSDDFLKEIEEVLQETSIEGEEEEPKEKDTAIETSGADTNGIQETNISDLTVSIQSALSKNEDLEVLRDLCSTGVPPLVRGDIWRAFLGVNKRPDAIGSWNGPLDCENQPLIHQDTINQSKRCTESEETQVGISNTMEEVISFYCKSRNVTYTTETGWAELLSPLASLGLSKSDLFNCLYVLLAKFIPRDCKAGGRPFDLFRLLLLYHDPHLCSMIDTRKLYPHLYLQPWLRSIFSGQCSVGVVHTLWDLYLIERDPFLVFFLALVMVINAKELIQESPVDTPVDDLNSLILTLPQQLTSEDITDLFSLAQYYAVRTPQSFRKDYHNMLFGTSRSLSSVSTGALCLPVQMQEVIDSLTNETTAGIKYFIVDCRPLQHFSAGHIPGAMHMDTDLLLHSPKDFSTAMDRLCDRIKQNGGENGEHLCFLGSGREQEDQYMNMVLAKFLQQSVPYISVARGGFLEMWRLLGARAGQLLEDFDSELCQQLYEDSRTSSNPSPSRSDCNSDSDTEAHLGYYYKQRLQEKSAQLYTSLATGWRDKSQRLRVRMGELWKSRQVAAYKQRPLVGEEKKKNGKRYHNLPENVFVIADDEEEEGEREEVGGAESQLVNISLYCTSPEILHSFPCTEVTDSGHMATSHLLLTSKDLIILREAPDRAGWGRVKHRENLSTILKITAKKHHPDIVTFKLGHHDNGAIVLTHQIRVRLPNTRKATEAIRNTVEKANQ